MAAVRAGPLHWTAALQAEPGILRVVMLALGAVHAVSSWTANETADFMKTTFWTFGLAGWAFHSCTRAGSSYISSIGSLARSTIIDEAFGPHKIRKPSGHRFSQRASPVLTNLNRTFFPIFPNFLAPIPARGFKEEERLGSSSCFVLMPTNMLKPISSHFQRVFRGSSRSRSSFLGKDKLATWLRYLPCAGIIDTSSPFVNPVFTRPRHNASIRTKGTGRSALTTLEIYYPKG